MQSKRGGRGMNAIYEQKGQCVWITFEKTKWELDELKALIREIEEDLE